MTSKEVSRWMKGNSPHTPTAGVERRSRSGGQSPNTQTQPLSTREAASAIGVPAILVERTMRPTNRD